MESRRVQIDFSSRDLRKLIIPLMIEQLLGITVGMADSMMVAQLGEEAISAVSLVDNINILIFSLFSSLATGGAIIVGQYLGRREPKKAGHASMQLLLFMLEASFITMGLCYAAKGLVLNHIFGKVEPAVKAYANTYYNIVEASIPFLAIYCSGASLFRVMGNSKISMKISLCANIVNVAGNAIMIFGLHSGVEGVAIPTALSRIVGASLMLYMLKKPDLTIQMERFTLRHDRYVIKHILHFGVPNGLEGSMFQMGKILLISTIATLGTASVAANAISNTVTGFQTMPGGAIGIAMVTVVSQCVGAGAFDKARYYTKKLVKYSYVAMWVAGAVLLLALPLIFKIYGVSEEAEGYARLIILLHTFFGFVIWPISFILPNSLRAAGDTQYTMIVSSGSMWIVRVGCGVLFGTVLHFGVVGIWMAMFVDWIVRSGIFLWRFHSGAWERMGLKEND